MSRVWTLFKAHPYISNVAGYTTLFASADLIQQIMLKGERLKEHGKSPKSNLSEMGLSTEGHMPTPRVLQQKDSLELDTRAAIDWSQTAKVALVGFCFHANFNYHWLRGLERMLPGGGLKKISGKVVLDQLVAAPATISAFFIGLSMLENREDLFEDWREKFFTSYKTGIVYWSTMQALNFALVPLVARTVFVGGITLVWTVFLCNFRQQRSLTVSH